MIPSCANWSIWTGEEVEGHTELGVKTLFLRSAPESISKLPVESLTQKGTITRLWVCKEFRNWGLLRRLIPHFTSLCIECTPGTISHIPQKIRNLAQLYVKVEVQLKEGDHICVGPPFSDESFKIGTGNKVNPEQYKNDKKIL